MNAHAASGDVPGVVCAVSRSGETHVDLAGVAVLGAPEPMRRDTIFRIASLTKPISAVAALSLVEECKLRLDAPIDPYLPELADRKVLRRIDGPLHETVPAERPISLRDLLTCRMGLGTLVEPSSQYPIQQAIAKLSISTGPQLPSAASPEAFVRDVGSLPLMAEPGQRWIYDTSFDVLGVLIERAAGKPFEAVLRERVFEPLGMKDTSFSVPAAKLDRLAGIYQRSAASRQLEPFDDPKQSAWSRPPGFASGAGGLVSTVDDLLAFGRMLLDYGKHGRERVLSRPSVELMTCDHISPEQKARSTFFPGFWDTTGWGFGVGIVTRRDDHAGLGCYGWSGGYGTLLHMDPHEDLVGVFLSQRVFDTSGPPVAYFDFLALAYQALDD
ncbi:MAG TPA: serine hydrolase domain-containing protein [Polyangiales bacterium]|nr:serine hydrolase domain-containing protein [Polyangiales bacterium]